MALSDQLAELTARAKNAEEHAAAAQSKVKADGSPRATQISDQAA